MASHAAVGIDNNFASGEAAIANRAADNKLSGGINMVLSIFMQPFCRQHMIDNQFAHGFMNFVSMRDQLDKLPPGKKLAIDYSGVSYMDHTVNERFHLFNGEYALTGGTVTSVGKEGLKPTSHSDVSALMRG